MVSKTFSDFPIGCEVEIIKYDSDRKDRYGIVVRYEREFIKVQKHGGGTGGWYPDSLRRIQPPCPRCESNKILETDYICGECRYGV